MSQILVRRLTPEVKEGLRARAQRNGRSLEAEAREVLSAAAEPAVPVDETGLTLSQRIRKIWADVGLTEEEHRTIFERRPEDWHWPDRVDFSGPEWAHLDDPAEDR